MKKDILLADDLARVDEEIHSWKCPGCWAELKEAHSGRAPKCSRCGDYMAPINSNDLQGN